MLATSASGALVTHLDPYLPLLHAGTLLATAGAALLTTLRPDSPPAHWAGYQVVYGLGLGLCFQVPNVAAETVLHEADVPVEGEAREIVVEAYNEALRRTFCVGLAMARCAVLVGSFMEWRSVKEGKEGRRGWEDVAPVVRRGPKGKRRKGRRRSGGYRRSFLVYVGRYK